MRHPFPRVSIAPPLRIVLCLLIAFLLTWPPPVSGAPAGQAPSVIPLEPGRLIGIQNGRFGSRFNLDLQFAAHPTSFSCGLRDGTPRDQAGGYSGVDGWSKDAPAGLLVAFRDATGSVRSLPAAQGPFSPVDSPSLELGMTYQIVRGQAGPVELQLTVVSPFAPSAAPGDEAATFSTAPFFYVYVSAVNQTAEPAIGSILLGFNHAVGGVESFGNGRLVRYRFSNERGERALYTRDTPGLSGGTGALAARFSATGRVDGDVPTTPASSTIPPGAATPPAAASLPIPSIPGLPPFGQDAVPPGPPLRPQTDPAVPLPPGPAGQADGGFAWQISVPPGGRADAMAIYAGYSAEPAMQDRSVRPAQPLYYGYTARFDSLAAVVSYAEENQSRVVEATGRFEERLSHLGGDPASRYALAASVRGYLASTFLMREKREMGEFGTPRYVVWEGDCLYHNTVDVAHETAVFEGMVMPWTLRLLLESWASARTRDRFGTVILHDLGYDTSFLGSQAYSLLGGDMTAEEVANFALLARWYVASTADSAFVGQHRSLLVELGDSLRMRDGNGDGIVDRGAYYTTVDVPAAIHVAAQSSYLAVKQAAAYLALSDLLGGAEAERFRAEARKINATLGRTAASHPFGLLPTLLPGDWRAIANENRYTTETVGDLTLGGQSPNAIVADGLLYLALSGHQSVELNDLIALVAPSRWAAIPQLGLDSSQPRLHPGTPETWFSKLFVQQLLDDYLAATRPTLPRTGLNALALAGERLSHLGIWGYTDSWNFERGYPVNLGHYPRGVVSFAFTSVPWRGGGSVPAPGGILSATGR
ncbi:MAG: glycoside hydrolase family 52 protein [Dehalococcoidia bacterium]